MSKTMGSLGLIVRPNLSTAQHYEGEEKAVFCGRIFGIVVAVGSDAEGLEFGDVVEISKELDCWMGKDFIRAFTARFDQTERLIFQPDDGGNESYTVTREHGIAICWPSDVLCRWKSRAWGFHRQGEAPRCRPIADRVLIKLVPHPEKSAGGILLPHWMKRDEPYGEVVAVGHSVDDLMPGDWVQTMTDTEIVTIGEDGQEIRSRPFQFTRQEDPKTGEVFIICRRRYIIGRFDEKPSEEWLTQHSVELCA